MVGEDDFLLGRVFILILIRDPGRRRELKIKQVCDNFSERQKLILDTGTVLKPKEVTFDNLNCRRRFGSFAKTGKYAYCRKRTFAARLIASQLVEPGP